MWNLYVFTIIFLYAPSHKCNRNKSTDSLQTGRSHPDFIIKYKQMKASDMFRCSGCFSEVMFAVDRYAGEAGKPREPADVWRAGPDRDLQDHREGG